MSLASALKTLTQALAPAASRDALVLERDGLLASPPPAPASTLALLEAPACRCETCVHSYEADKATRLKAAAWAGRVQALERQLFALTWGVTWGDEKQRDAPGEALAELCHELLQAVDANRARPWERVVVRDLRGRPVEAYETAAALGEINLALMALYHQAHDVLVFLGTDELTKAIDETRARMTAALATPLRKKLEPEVAARAGTQPARMESEAERLGLRPGSTPNVLEGNIRFARR